MSIVSGVEFKKSHVNESSLAKSTPSNVGASSPKCHLLSFLLFRSNFLSFCQKTKQQTVAETYRRPRFDFLSVLALLKESPQKRKQKKERKKERKGLPCYLLEKKRK